MDRIKAVICALWGHSRIVKGWFGYVYCGRCGYQLGDTLGSTFNFEGYAIEGCDDKVCRQNYANMGWRDRFLAINPFKESK